jgi:hypothetical protein
LEGESDKIVVALSICSDCEAITNKETFRFEGGCKTRFEAIVELAKRYLGEPEVFGREAKAEGERFLVREGYVDVEVPIVAASSLAACYADGYRFGTLVDGGL